MNSAVDQCYSRYLFRSLMCIILIRLKYYLVIPDEPVIVSMTSSPIISQEWSSISLHCTGSSNPESAISWFYEGKSLVNDSRTTILVESQQRDVFKFVLKSTIFIRNLTRNDTGEYTCEASNGITTAVKKLEVIVQCKLCRV